MRFVLVWSLSETVFDYANKVAQIEKLETETKNKTLMIGRGGSSETLKKNVKHKRRKCGSGADKYSDEMNQISADEMKQLKFLKKNPFYLEEMSAILTFSGSFTPVQQCAKLLYLLYKPPHERTHADCLFMFKLLRPLKARNRLDFPEPERPINTSISPG